MVSAVPAGCLPVHFYSFYSFYSLYSFYSFCSFNRLQAHFQRACMLPSPWSAVCCCAAQVQAPLGRLLHCRQAGQLSLLMSRSLLREQRQPQLLLWPQPQPCTRNTPRQAWWQQARRAMCKTHVR
jgi:hypothetical protein